MTTVLQKAIHQLESLSESEQNTIAELILQELAWLLAFAQSQNQLGWLADEALREWKAGKTKPLDEWL